MRIIIRQDAPHEFGATVRVRANSKDSSQFVGEPKCLLLNLRETRQRDRGYFRKAEFLRCAKPTMSSDQTTVFVDQDRIGEAELPNRADDLLNLSFRVRARIARIRLERRNWAIADRQPTSGGKHVCGTLVDAWNIARTRWPVISLKWERAVNLRGVERLLYGKPKSPVLLTLRPDDGEELACSGRPQPLFWRITGKPLKEVKYAGNLRLS